MNIAPDLSQKAQILENAVWLAHALGIERPKVAAIAAVETVNPEMPATVDAAALAKMADRGQIKGCVVDGPLALDNALSVEAARHKGIDSPVAGVADVLLLPDIEAGNVLYKTIGLIKVWPMAADRGRRQRAGRAHVEGRLRRHEVQLDRARGRGLLSRHGGHASPGSPSSAARSAPARPRSPSTSRSSCAAETQGPVTLVDLDIVNLYFRSRQKAYELEQLGIRVVSSVEGMENADLPALSPEINACFDRKDGPVVFDLGGSDLGGLVAAYLHRGFAGRAEPSLAGGEPVPSVQRDARGDPRHGAADRGAIRGCRSPGMIANPHLISETTPAIIREGFARVLRGDAVPAGVPGGDGGVLHAGGVRRPRGAGDGHPQADEAAVGAWRYHDGREKGEDAMPMIVDQRGQVQGMLPVRPRLSHARHRDGEAPEREGVLPGGVHRRQVHGLQGVRADLPRHLHRDLQVALESHSYESAHERERGAVGGGHPRRVDAVLRLPDHAAERDRRVHVAPPAHDPGRRLHPGRDRGGVDQHGLRRRRPPGGGP